MSRPDITAKVTLQVVIGLIINDDQRVLLARRQAHQTHANKLEFPGGKIDPGEREYDALVREVKEEVDLDVQQAERIMSIAHSYPEYYVELNIWQVTEFQGKAQGKEGQTVFWCAIDKLDANDFPTANHAIIDYLVTRG